MLLISSERNFSQAMPMSLKPRDSLSDPLAQTMRGVKTDLAMAWLSPMDALCLEGCHVCVHHETH
jgi:hypothetical protein